MKGIILAYIQSQLVYLPYSTRCPVKVTVSAFEDYFLKKINFTLTQIYTPCKVHFHTYPKC